MTAWTPPPTDAVATADERTTLLTFLDWQRTMLARKATGLTDAQARSAACPPSDLTLLGLVRHATEVEHHWARRVFRGDDTPSPYCGPSHPQGDRDGDFHPPPEATLTEALERFSAEVEVANGIYAAAGLDDVQAADPGSYAGHRLPAMSLRWILVHLIEEHARHCGHADLLRQAIDGSTGE